MKHTLTSLFFALLSMSLWATHTPHSTPHSRRPEKIGLCLSGGGALGFAHIGALQALNDYGIYPDMVSGSSMGAIIGSLYAAGYSPKHILQVIKKERLYKLNRLITIQSALRNSGASSHATLQKELNALMPHSSFEELTIPFIVCVTDLDKGEAVYVDGGDQLNEYVVASASIPGIFESKKIKGTEYVDGGVTDNLPAVTLKERGCDYVIGVDVLPFVQNHTKKNSLNVALWSLRLMMRENSKAGREACDFVVTPYSLLEFHEFQFDKYLEIYQYGYNAMSKYLADNPETAARISSAK